MGVCVHEHKASGFILTLNEKLTNYSSNPINMQADICYLGVNSRGIFLGGRNTHVCVPLVSLAAGEQGSSQRLLEGRVAVWESPYMPSPGASPLSDPHSQPRGEGVGSWLEMERDLGIQLEGGSGGGGCTV